MKRWIASASVVLGFLVSLQAQAEHTRVTNPSALTLELGGRGLLYSLNFDRVLDDHSAAGLGFGTVGTQTTAGVSTGNSATMLPAYFNYYFMKEQGSLYATAGATVLLNSGTVKDTETKVGGMELESGAVLPNLGLGYENRSDAGFLFRATAYGIYTGKVNPWFGVSFGYSF